MKRFISVLSSLLVLPAFAEVSPVYYDDVIEYTDDATAGEDSVESGEQKNVQQRTTVNRSTSASRAISSAPATSSRTNTGSRAVASSPRTATAGASRGTVARTTKTSGVTARPSTTASRATVTSRNTQNTKPVVSRVAANSKNIMSGYRGTDGTAAYLTDSGNRLYNATGTSANMSGASRVGVAGRRASARISTPVTPVTTATTITQEDVTSTTSNLTNIAELTEYCKTQYAACMDNYCNVLDDNQGRCSCSKNIKNYEKAEQTLAQASEDFQNVVQQIRYIGLTTDQIESLFTETEAELTMKSTTDSSRLKNSLDSIKKKIVDVSTPSATSTVTNGLSLDMNGLLTADFTAGFDLNSFLNMNNNSSSSVSNQRGEQLYKTAASRCKTAVLNSCTTQGIDANIVTNAYDLEIDKQCVLYERSLNDANSEMKQNAMNATTILQQARLLLAQNRNSYDLRGCVAAIDSCMQDEYICGADYELCLDPTGKYLANGEVVKGGTPGVSGGHPRTTAEICSTACDLALDSCQPGSHCVKTTTPGSATTPTITTITCDNDYVCTLKEYWTSKGMYNLYSTWDYNSHNYNAWSMGEKENLGDYIDEYLSKWKNDYKKSKDSTYTDNMAMYLLQKIGYIDDNDKVHGMCASVMKQCQDYTYKTTSSRKSTRKYSPDNEVVRQYLNNTLAKIKVQQDAVIADYAEGCRNDVTSCLSTNGYDETAPNSTATKTAINACAAEITTCMSVGGYQITDGVKLTLRAMSDWVASIMLTCGENQYLVDDGVGAVSCKQCPTVPVLVDFMNQDGVGGNAQFTGHNHEDEGDGVYEYVSAISAIEIDNSLYTSTKDDYVSLISSGGRATSCSCPEGYTAYNPVGTTLKPLARGMVLCVDDTIKCGYTLGDPNKCVLK